MNEAKTQAAGEGAPQVSGPAALMQLAFAHVPARVLGTSVQLRVFSHIGEGGATAEEVARSVGATERGTRMILDALVGLQLLAKRDGRYFNTPMSSQYLVAESPDYVGGMWESPEWFEQWNQLTEVVRTGAPVNRVEMQDIAELFFTVLVRGLHVMNLEPARRTAEAAGAHDAAKGLRVLDVACGSGVWGIAFAEANPQTRVTAHDFEGLFRTTREYLQRHNVEGQYDFLAGDLKDVDFGKERYDVAILGNIVHSEGEASSRNLFARMHRALRRGGRLLIMDMVPNDERTGPPFPLFFALNMLLHTEHGDTYTLAEYTSWLTDAGFTRVETTDINSHSPLIIAHK